MRRSGESNPRAPCGNPQQVSTVAQHQHGQTPPHSISGGVFCDELLDPSDRDLRGIPDLAAGTEVPNEKSENTGADATQEPLPPFGEEGIPRLVQFIAVGADVVQIQRYLHLRPRREESGPGPRDAG